MTIIEFNSVCGLMAQAAGIAGHVLVAQEEHATNALKDKPGIWLVGVLPTTEVSGDVDAEIDGMVTLLFVLEQANLGQDNADEIKQYQRTHDAIMKIRQYIADDVSGGCSLFRRYDPSSIMINPEYQIFSDYNGWSMTLEF